MKIKISTIINSPISKIWDYYTNPEHIINWNNASEDWHTTKSENDLKVGGRFLSRMEAKDGSQGFDFEGEYTKIENQKCLNYIMDDGREVEITFDEINGKTNVIVVFDPEKENPIELQQHGWQAILDNFKRYVESN